MIIVYFVLGGIHTIFLLAVGIYIGYSIRIDKLEKPAFINKLTNKLINKSAEAGPVKPITKVEREAEAQKGFTDRVKELTTD